MSPLCILTLSDSVPRPTRGSPSLSHRLVPLSRRAVRPISQEVFSYYAFRCPSIFFVDTKVVHHFVSLSFIVCP